MQVLEQFTLGKSGDVDDCEDCIIVTDHYAAVIDGATDKTAWRSAEGRAGGQVAMDACCAAIASLPPDASARQAVEAMTIGVREATIGAPADKPSASVGVLAAHSRQIWLVGDISYWFSGVSTSPRRKPLDSVLATARSIAVQTYLLEGFRTEDLQIHDLGREDICPLLRRQYLMRNVESPWGYGAIDGSDVPSAFVEVVSVPLGIGEIVLCSDGYPSVDPSLAKAEVKLAKQLDEDPLCSTTMKCTKGLMEGNVSYDDRAYLRLRL